MTVVGDNAAPLDGWQVQPGRHCGELCFDRVCPICLNYLPTPLDGRGDN